MMTHSCRGYDTIRMVIQDCPVRNQTLRYASADLKARFG